MADREFRIKIITESGSAQAGVAAAVAGLDQVRDSAEQSGKAHEAAGEAAKEHGSKLLHAGSGAKELHKAMHLIAEESPLVGLALKAAMSPIGAALTGAIVLFHEVSASIEELNKELDELAKEAAKPMENMREAAVKVRDEIRAANAEYEEWIKNVSKAHDLMKESLTDETEAIHARAEQNREDLKVKTELKKQQIEQALAAGQISPTTAALALGALDAKSTQAGRGITSGETAAVIAAKEEALAKLDEKRAAAGDHVEATHAAATDSSRLLQMEKLTERLKGLDEKNLTDNHRRELVDAADAARKKFYLDPNAAIANNARADQAIAQFDQDRRLQEQSQENLAKLQQVQKSADTAFKEAQDSAVKFKAEWDALSLEVARAKEKFAITSGGEHVRSGPESQIAAGKTLNELRNTSFGGEVINAAEGAYTLQHRGRMTAQQQQAVQQLQEDLHLNNFFMNNVLQILAAHAKDLPSLVTDIQRLQAQIRGGYTQ